MQYVVLSLASLLAQYARGEINQYNIHDAFWCLDVDRVTVMTGQLEPWAEEMRRTLTTDKDIFSFDHLREIRDLVCRADGRRRAVWRHDGKKWFESHHIDALSTLLKGVRPGFAAFESTASIWHDRELALHISREIPESLVIWRPEAPELQLS